MLKAMKESSLSPGSVGMRVGGQEAVGFARRNGGGGGQKTGLGIWTDVDSEDKATDHGKSSLLSSGFENN
jgi:hypothetical protein